MWNAAGASLAIAMYLNCRGDHKEYSYGGCSVGVYKYGLQFGSEPGVNWDDLKEEDLNKCVMPMLHCGACEIIFVPELLRDMLEWQEVQSVTYIQREGNTRILEVIAGGANHCVVAYPYDNPVLLVTDASLSRMITNLKGSWFVRERFGMDDAGRAMKVGFNSAGTCIVFKDSISVHKVIDYLNDGIPDDTSGIIGENIYNEIKNIIQSSTDWLERYKILVSTLRGLDEDLPDMLDVALRAGRENKEV